MITRSVGARSGIALLCAALVLVVTTGCGSSGSGVVRPPTDSLTSSIASTPAPATSTTPTGHAHPTISVVPSRALADHATVQVHGAGFTPNEPLQVIECAARGNATGPGDCNLTGMLSVSSDDAGKVSAALTVLRGPFGASRVTCTTKHPCLVSVTQASLNPSEEADAAITFAP